MSPTGLGAKAWAAALLAAGAVATGRSARAEEELCRDLGSACVCSEPLNTTVLIPRGGSWYDPGDSTVKECVVEDLPLPAYSGATITRNSSDLFGASDAAALGALPGGHRIDYVVRGPEGHTGTWSVGNTKVVLGSTRRLAARWYRYYSSNFQFADEAACQNSKVAQNGPGNMIFDHHGGPIGMYGMYSFGWTPNLDCCFAGSPGGDAVNASMTPAKWRGKWWRFEAVVVNPGGGSSPNGLKAFLYVKNVTDDEPEFTAVDSTIPCTGCGPDDWTLQAATALTPPAPLNGVTINLYRQNVCSGWSATSHYLMAAWDSDQGQRIGAAHEIEGHSTLPSLAVEDVAVPEGHAGAAVAVFTTRLSAASAQAVTVSYATANQTATAGVDYQAASGTLTIAAGATTGTIAVSVVGDTTIEPDETFAVNLSGAVGATIADGQGVGTIADDDAPALARRELSHGSSLWEDFSGQTGPAGQDAYRLVQGARSSYEVTLDGVSGDAWPVVLERLAADNATVLQTGVSTGAGRSVSLRWENASGSAVVNQHVRVRSGPCGSACGPDDVYRVRAWETTGAIVRFNNGGSQATVLVLQNPGAQAVAGRAYFWSGSGALLATHPFTLAGRATLVLNTSGVSGLSGQSGSITLTHDGGYGGLAGKAVSLEPATGYSFDSPLTARAR